MTRSQVLRLSRPFFGGRSPVGRAAIDFPGSVRLGSLMQWLNYGPELPLRIP